jgi:hypothetical protein
MSLPPPPAGRRRWRALLWAALFAVGLQLAVGLALEAGPVTVRDPEYAAKEAQLRARRAEAPGRLLVVMLGSSRTMLGLQAGRLGRDTDAPGLGYNFGMIGAGPMLEAVALRRLLAAGLRPDLLLVEVLTPDLNRAGDGYVEEDWLNGKRFSAAELERVCAYHSRPGLLRRHSCQSRCLPFLRPQPGLRRWLGLDLPRGERPPGGRRTDRYGWEAYSPPDLTRGDYQRRLDMARRQYQECFGAFRLADGPARALRELLDDCRGAAVPAVLVLMPEGSDFRALYPAAVLAGIRRFLAETAREEGVPVIDARCWIEDEGFWDGHHLRPAGAAAFTERLGRDLVRPLLRQLARRPGPGATGP